MKKNFNLIIAMCIMLCVFSCSVTVFAEPDAVTGEVVTVPGTQAEFTEAPESEQNTQQPDETDEAITDDILVPSDYEAPVTTTEKSTSQSSGSVNATTPSTTRRPNKQDNSPTREQNNSDDEEEETGEPVSFGEDESLPDGQFYVYAEKNNGTPRLKLILDKPSLIGEPSIPVREGFIFDGWYKDAKFTEIWSFYSDMAQEGTVIYAKWVPDPNAVVYNVTVKQTPGGTIEVNPAVASVGEPVVITVNPDEGMRLVSGSITVNGVAQDILSFAMPAQDVVVSVSFEEIPDSEKSEDAPSVVPFVVIAIALVIIVAVIVAIIIRRRDMYTEDEIDENGTVIDDDDDDKSWVDESIVVEDGFKDGEKVIGNFIPESDYAIYFDNEDDE